MKYLFIIYERSLQSILFSGRIKQVNAMKIQETDLARRLRDMEGIVSIDDIV